MTDSMFDFFDCLHAIFANFIVIWQFVQSQWMLAIFFDMSLLYILLSIMFKLTRKDSD